MTNRVSHDLIVTMDRDLMFYWFMSIKLLIHRLLVSTPTCIILLLVCESMLVLLPHAMMCSEESIQSQVIKRKLHVEL